MPKRIRTFVAVEMAAGVRARIAELQQELTEAGADVRWVDRESLHLTLKFLGDVDERDLYAVCKTAERAVSDLAPFELRVVGAGAFPSFERPHILWVGITQGTAGLAEMQERLEAAFEPEGYSREARAFTAHVTIGRTRGRQSSRELSSALEAQKDWQGGAMTVNEVRVFSSQPGPEGPRYTVMGRTRLVEDGER